MDSKQYIGQQSKVYHLKFDQERWNLFCTVLGVEPSTAVNSDVIPTIFTVCRLGEFDLIESFDGEMRHVLHAEQEYQFKNQLQVGEILEYQTVLENVHERNGKSGRMHFMLFKTSVKTERLGEIAVCGSTLVYREMAT